MDNTLRDILAISQMLALLAGGLWILASVRATLTSLKESIKKLESMEKKLNKVITRMAVMEAVCRTKCPNDCPMPHGSDLEDEDKE